MQYKHMEKNIKINMLWEIGKSAISEHNSKRIYLGSCMVIPLENLLEKKQLERVQSIILDPKNTIRHHLDLKKLHLCLKGDQLKISPNLLKMPLMKLVKE